MAQTDKRDGLYPSEFAALYGISKDTLLYYDKIGLLHPQLRASNGYRLYSLDQVHRFDLLMMLRSTNLPLNEIAACLQDYQPQQILDLLRSQAEKLSTEITNLQKLHSKMLNTAETIECGLKMEYGVPRLEKREEAHFLSIETTPEIIRNRYLRMAFVRKHLNSGEAQKLTSDFLRNGIIRRENLEQGRFAKDYFCIRVDSPGTGSQGQGKIITQPQGLYAVMEHKGSYDTLDGAYRALIDYIRSQSCIIAGNGYETEVLGYAVFQDSNDYVIQLAIQVEKM